MSTINSFTDRTSKLLFSPAHLANNVIGKAYYHHNGRELFCFGMSVSALLLTQAIVSVAAVPIQILAGVFSCAHQFSKGAFKEGIKEFKNGLITSVDHAGAVPLSALASIGVALYIIISLPCCIRTWNVDSEWWSPGVPV